MYTAASPPGSDHEPAMDTGPTPASAEDWACNSGSYPDHMATTDARDAHRKKLTELGEEARTYPLRRFEAVAAARADGMTWREAAALLNVTEHGLIKADKTERAKRAPEDPESDS
jgi:hypothetical protein